MQLTPIELAVTITGASLIILTLWYLRPRATWGAPPPASFQEVVVRILPDRFEPATIVFSAGSPAKIRFQRHDGSDEWETCVAPNLSIERKLPAGKITTIDVTSDEPGVYPFHSGVVRRDGFIIIQAMNPVSS